MRVDLNKVLIGAAVLALGLIGYFVMWWNHEIRITREQEEHIQERRGPFTGQPCPHISERPIAVMLASDPVARPLAGIGQADVVVEMPVTPGPNAVTRMMALFHCNKPQEIGSIRSARADFLPFAGAFRALYAHWGGESDTLDQLNQGVLDNIDALKYDGTTFYRKQEIRKPHNGFTTLDLLRERAKELGYSLENSAVGYIHGAGSVRRNVSSLAEVLEIIYDPPYQVRWEYDRGTKRYRRLRGGTAEIDRLTNQQVTAGAIVVFKTNAIKVRDQYLALELNSPGTAILYQEGVKTNITWKKDRSRLDSPLEFYDQGGREVTFAPGPLWIEVVTETQ